MSDGLLTERQSHILPWPITTKVITQSKADELYNFNNYLSKITQLIFRQIQTKKNLTRFNFFQLTATYEECQQIFCSE